MNVFIDPDSGFCFGVKRAIQTAEAELNAGNTVYSLGEMVHNQVQMNQLKAKGLKVISLAKFPSLSGKTVLIRAHGEPPETFHLAQQFGITLVDATCPIVTKLQQRIQKSTQSDVNESVQIVVFGKKGHAEVAGLVGNARNGAIVIQDVTDLESIDFTKPVRLFSQTTMDGEKYQSIGVEIQNRLLEAGNHDLVIQKSVCGQVSGRAPALREFAAKYEVILFVSGNNSSNGAYLFGVCKAVNAKSYFVNSIDDIDSQWFAGVNNVGVSGATSSPDWLIAQIAEYVKSIKG